MSFNSENRDKLDTIDLIITALKEHEKLLDSVYNKLETLVDKISVKEPEKISESLLIVSCDKWSDFKFKCKSVDVITFEMDGDTFYVYAKLNGEVLRYSEKISRNSFKIIDDGKQFIVDKIYFNDLETPPFFNGTLRCGLKLFFKTSKILLTETEFLLNIEYEIDSSIVKEFLSKELSVHKNNIVEGKITF